MNMTTRRKHTKAEMQRALLTMKQLYALTPHELAERRMADAKTDWTAAAEAALRGDRDAAERVTEALQELETARAELRRLTNARDGEPQGAHP